MAALTFKTVCARVQKLIERLNYRVETDRGDRVLSVIDEATGTLVVSGGAGVWPYRCSTPAKLAASIRVFLRSTVAERGIKAK